MGCCYSPLQNSREQTLYFPVPDATVGGSDSHTQISKPETVSDPSCWNGKRVIDLGSGTGIVGIVAGVLGKRACRLQMCGNLRNDSVFTYHVSSKILAEKI